MAAKIATINFRKVVPTIHETWHKDVLWFNAASMMAFFKQRIRRDENGLESRETNADSGVTSGINRRGCVLHVGEVVRGGIATYLKAAIPAQQQRFGEHVVVGLYPACFEADLSSVFLAPQLVPWTNRRPLSLFRYALAVIRAIHRLQPCLVHAHSTFAGAFVRLAVWSIPKRRRPIIVYCAHGWAFLQDIPLWKRHAYAMLERLLTPLADGVVHISQDEARGAARYGIKPTLQVTIYNGLIDEEMSTTLPTQPCERKLTLLFVGRFDRQKGLDILLEAIKRVRRDILVHIVGGAVIPGGDVRLPTADKRVVFHGWLTAETLKTLYYEVDIVVMPSRWEGFGFVALEAMRAGRAVFAADRGALPELIVEGETGRLFDPQNSDALSQLIEEADRRDLKRMGEAARTRYLTKFTIEESNAQLLRLYDTLITRLEEDSTV